MIEGSFYFCSSFEDKRVKHEFNKACCNMKCILGKGELILNQYSGKYYFDVYKSNEEFLIIWMYFD